MGTMQDDGQYHITNNDIEQVINVLKITNPSKANPETAVKILTRLHKRFKSLEEISPEIIEEVQKDLEEY